MGVFNNATQKLKTGVYIGLGLLALESATPSPGRSQQNSLEGTVLAISQDHPEGIPVYQGNVVLEGMNADGPYQISDFTDSQGKYQLILGTDTSTQETSFSAIKALYGSTPVSRSILINANQQLEGKSEIPPLDSMQFNEGLRLRVMSAYACMVDDSLQLITGKMTRNIVTLSRQGWHSNDQDYVITDTQALGAGKWVNHPDGIPIMAIFEPEITDQPLKVYFEFTLGEPNPWDQVHLYKTYRTWMMEKLDELVEMGYDFQETSYPGAASIIYRMSPDTGARVVATDAYTTESNVKVIRRITVEVFEGQPYAPNALARTLFMDAQGYGTFDYGYNAPGIFSPFGGPPKDEDIVSHNAMLFAAELTLEDNMHNNPATWWSEYKYED